MWIRHIPYEEADGRLKTLYDRVKGPGDNVDNVMLVHSLRPASMEGHMALYKSVLHHFANQTPKWFLETIGVYVSRLNGCHYCEAHHIAGLRRLVGDAARADRLIAAIAAERFAGALNTAQTAAMGYARTLTLTPQAEDALRAALAAMRATGLSDGEILEINQVTAYFNYANRTVLGLGVSTEGDILGLSPGNSADPEDWSHH